LITPKERGLQKEGGQLEAHVDKGKKKKRKAYKTVLAVRDDGI